MTDHIKELPKGDVLVHAGDFSNVGRPEEILHFNEFLAQFTSFKHKVVIAGNHDISFDVQAYPKIGPVFHGHRLCDPVEVRKTLTGCTYLENSGCVIDGVRFWGVPQQPRFFDWAFNEDRGAPISKYWEQVPTDTDVLITHGPALGHGDLCKSNDRAGCLDLLREIQTRIKPQFLVCGHVHEGYGVTSDSTTTYVNASTCNFSYQGVNPPIVVDVQKPKNW